MWPSTALDHGEDIDTSADRTEVAISPTQVGVGRVLWVPTLGTACGIAEYTRLLAQAEGSVGTTAQRPDMDKLTLLHVQHEFSLFNDGDLSSCVTAARDHGVPTVVTEHSVILDAGHRSHYYPSDEPLFATLKREWESAVDALVALTETGTNTLRTRWPGKRIVHIPHGCPTWFPSRKPERGRVIGAFGFLAPYKGYWDLLEVLREVPGTQLLIFSHPRYTCPPDVERDWVRASEGLPVRWVRDFLPDVEIAARLAAEADIVAFWYHAGSFASASGAVRVGLATGVPVLTSPIGTFQDVRSVTYQPDDLVDGVRRLLEDTPLRDRLTNGARDYCQTNSWFDSARRHVALWCELEEVRLS